MTTAIDTKRVRASALPLAAICPASLSPGLQVEFSDDTGNVGTEIHRALAMRLRGEQSPELDVASEEMVALGLNWVRSQNPKQLETELALSDDHGSGTIDACWYEDHETGAIADFKTGFRDDNHWPQQLRYAHLRFQSRPQLKRLKMYVVWLRKEGVDFKIVERDYADLWWSEFRRNVIDHPDVYRTGDHCSRCRRRIDCPALGAINKQTAMVLADAPGQLSLTREKMIELRPKVKLLKDVIKDFEEAVRAEVLANGPIPMGEGKELAAKEIKKDTIRIQRALPVLQDGQFTDEEIDTFVTVGKTKMLAVLAAKISKGKGRAQDALMEKLDAAGAVQKHTEIQIREQTVKGESK